jgi:hypothetical protein
MFLNKNVIILTSLEKSKLLSNTKLVYLISAEDKHIEMHSPMICLILLQND